MAEASNVVSRQPCIVPKCNHDVYDVAIGILGLGCIHVDVERSVSGAAKKMLIKQRLCYSDPIYVVYVVLRPYWVFVSLGGALNNS